MKKTVNDGGWGRVTKNGNVKSKKFGLLIPNIFLRNPKGTSVKITQSGSPGRAYTGRIGGYHFVLRLIGVVVVVLGLYFYFSN